MRSEKSREETDGCLKSGVKSLAMRFSMDSVAMFRRRLTESVKRDHKDNRTNDNFGCGIYSSAARSSVKIEALDRVMK